MTSLCFWQNSGVIIRIPAGQVEVIYHSLRKGEAQRGSWILPSSREHIWGQWAAFFRVNHSGAQEEMLTSTLCFRAMSICPVSDVALDSSASRKNSVLKLCTRMRRFHAWIFGSKHALKKKKRLQLLVHWILSPKALRIRLRTYIPGKIDRPWAQVQRQLTSNNVRLFPPCS